MSHESTRESVELVRRFYELSQQYRNDRWDHVDLLARTVVYRPIADWPDSGVCRGRVEYRSFMEAFWSGDAWEEISYAATSHFGIGDKVITRLELDARGRGSASETHARIFTVATVDEGRIVCLEDFVDRDEALAVAWQVTPVSPNVETIRSSLALIEAEGTRAAPLLAATWRPDIRWTPAATGAAGPKTYVGHDEMRGWLAERFSALGPVTVGEREFREVGDRVLALYTLGTADGPTRRPGADLWRFADGRIVEGHGYLSHEEAIAAAGLGDA